MDKPDLRKLRISEQETIRVKVLKAVDEGMRKKDVMSTFGVSDAVIYKWLAVRDNRKENWSKQEKRGRPSQISLTVKQEKQVKKMIIENCPDDLNLRFNLWSRAAVGELLRVHFGLIVSTWTIGRYMQNWGLTPPKPIYKGIEKKSSEVKRWLKKDYPVIQKRAINETVEIHWGEEMGMRSHNLAAVILPIKGEPTVVSKTKMRYRLNMISSLTNRGKLKFMLFKGEFTVAVFIEFMSRLISDSPRKVFLIVDGNYIHGYRGVKEWLGEHSDRIELFLLPGYTYYLKPQDWFPGTSGRQKLSNKS